MHEFEGTVRVVEDHNHRFAGVSSQVIPFGSSHYHKIRTKTDFYEDHFHLIVRNTGLAKDVGGGRHVHFLNDGLTTTADGHHHPFRLATLIQDPIGDK
ncbi:MAG: YmaF family protein [Solirubrobacterales bacterium]